MLGVFLFVPAVVLIALGIMYLTGKGLGFLVNDQNIDEEQVAEYVSKRNPVNNCRFFGIIMLLGAVYCIIVAIGVLVNVPLMTAIATFVAAAIAAGASIFYYTSNLLKAKEIIDGRNKNVKD